MVGRFVLLLSFSSTIFTALALPKQSYKKVEFLKCLIRVGYTEARERDIVDDTFFGFEGKWRSFKGSVTPEPATVDLSQECVKSRCNIEEAEARIAKITLDVDLEEEFVFSWHEYALLLLREGDTVIFDGVPFKLGRFLGAGNATHIFALADEPDKVIRIPFLSAHMRRVVHSKNLDVLRIARHFNKKSMDTLEQIKGSVELDPRSDFKSGKFYISDRVYGDESADNFIISLFLKFEDKRISLEEPLKFDELKSIAASSIKEQDLKRKAMDLIDLIGKNSRERYKSINNFRQYLWDKKKKKWFVIDADPPSNEFDFSDPTFILR